MTWLIFLWLFGAVVVTPLALYWRPGARGEAGGPALCVVLAIGAGGLIAGAYLSLGGIA
ncbi:hypothetical protein [Devosia nitrariae]|uniref:Uncharacterized protein n=1 Tax=Devosia nitrariae TaxID=2071872 RepID=A0ABQ5WB17_9HYPH|nr:hypothetical protein [Devosia nitrariae]GLQ57283.1 hypothetical protein GCM10010862_45420 [Devosia nitrariae]